MKTGHQTGHETDAAWDSAEYNARRAERAEAEVELLREECEWQARLVGMGTEREIKLQAENERLRDLLKQAAAELAVYIHAEHVTRHRYPENSDINRRYNLDMAIVREINAAIDARAK
jgi:hypothetical protein